MNNRNAYTPFRQFGNTNQPPCAGTGNDPLQYCLTESSDGKFFGGGIANLFGPRSQKCISYMGERCAQNWDGFCEFYYQNNSNPDSLLNDYAYPNTSQPLAWQNDFGLNPTLSTDEQLLQNAARNRFCTMVNCKPRVEPFNPTNPDSVNITYYENLDGCGQKCMPVCNQFDPATLDTDPVMNRMLANPNAAASTLINMCNSAKRDGINIAGTKFGAFCNKYQQNVGVLQQNPMFRK